MEARGLTGAALSAADRPAPLADLRGPGRQARTGQGENRPRLVRTSSSRPTARCLPLRTDPRVELVGPRNQSCRGSSASIDPGVVAGSWERRPMRLYRSGDRSAGICEHCQARVNIRMEYRDYTPSGWGVTVPDVLVAVCERCGEVVGIPHQSTPRINEYRRGQGRRPGGDRGSRPPGDRGRRGTRDGLARGRAQISPARDLSLLPESRGRRTPKSRKRSRSGP